jgi:DNA-binding transcriptional MocR family regulator
LSACEQDADGINLDDLDATLMRERAAGARVNLLYLVPNFQNPAGILLSSDKRARCSSGPSAATCSSSRTIPTASCTSTTWPGGGDATDQGRRSQRPRHLPEHVFKTLAPGFRVAWVAAPAQIVERFDTAKQSMDLMCGILDQRVVHQSIVRGVLDRQAAPLRKLYRQRRDIMEQALREQFGDRLSWSQPKGGFFLWAQLPEGVECQALLDKAMEQGVIFVIGSAFCVDGSGHDRVRLSFSWPTPDRMREGARRLALALEAYTVRT